MSWLRLRSAAAVLRFGLRLRLLPCHGWARPRIELSRVRGHATFGDRVNRCARFQAESVSRLSGIAGSV